MCRRRSGCICSPLWQLVLLDVRLGFFIRAGWWKFRTSLHFHTVLPLFVFFLTKKRADWTLSPLKVFSSPTKCGLFFLKSAPTRPCFISKVRRLDFVLLKKCAVSIYISHTQCAVSIFVPRKARPHVSFFSSVLTWIYFWKVRRLHCATTRYTIKSVTHVFFPPKSALTHLIFIDWFWNPIFRTNWDVRDVDKLSWDI